MGLYFLHPVAPMPTLPRARKRPPTMPTQHWPPDAASPTNTTQHSRRSKPPCALRAPVTWVTLVDVAACVAVADVAGRVCACSTRSRAVACICVSLRTLRAFARLCARQHSFTADRTSCRVIPWMCPERWQICRIIVV
jgi:hypothetical protein